MDDSTSGSRRLTVLGGTIALTVAGLVAIATAAPPVPGTGVVSGNPQQEYAWDAADGYQAQPVTFPSRRSGAVLAGTLYAPRNLGQLDRLPSAVVIPPSGGAATQYSVAFVAKVLARDSFLALTVDPQGVGQSPTLGETPCDGSRSGRSNPSPCANVPFQQMDNFFDAGQSALDFLLGPNDPWLAHVDPKRVGAVGHSEGARAATYLQDPKFDGRAHAVVALDNLTTNYCGDAGTPSSGGPAGGTGAQNAVINGEPYCLYDPNSPSTPDDPKDDPNFQVHAHAPALGLASDDNWRSDPTGLSGATPEDKKAAFLAWRAAGVPAMELVLKGVNHLQFSQTSTSNETLLYRIAYYTRAWFERWLKPNTDAAQMLTACTVPDQNGAATSLGDFLSTNYRSSYYLPPSVHAATKPHVLEDEDIQGTCSATS